MNISSIKLSKDAVIWLKAAWDYQRENGRPPSYQAIRLGTKDFISNAFRPLDLPKELADNNATEITLVGVLCCDPSTNILDIADRIFEYIKTKINASPEQTEFESRVIANDLGMAVIEVEITLNLISKYGSFWGSASKPADSAGYTNFKIDNPHVYEMYSTHDSARAVIEANIEKYKIVESVNRRLAERRQQQTEKNTLLYALSTERNESPLVTLGLTNRGVIGFILSNYVEGTSPLTAIKLQFRSDDFLYTTKLAAEKLENRNPTMLGVVGYVFNEQRPNTIQLYRYFDQGNLVHLFTTKPKNIPKTFRNESNDNPIYLYEVIADGTVPLYFYSNQATVFSESISDSDEKISTSDELITEIAKLIHNRSDIKIIESHEMEPAIGVEQLAAEVAAVITHLKVEPGNMTGIFGPWGRGKSYLMNFIWKSLEAQAKNIKYHKVTYQAWRYQDTPAAWAYLYETFSRCYLGDPKTSLGNFLKYNWRLWKLNIHREGYLTLLTILLLLLAGSLSYTIATFNWNEIGLQVLKILGVPAAGFLIYFIGKNLNLSYFTKAFNIIKKYGIRATFKENLGIQAEIQKEIVHLISAWTDSEKPKSKVILFVDDLDRCREEKTIEIIDSLRIILDDEQVKDKLIVVCAIDDRILKRAIIKKYSDVENQAASLLVKEYIDKLFIFTLKLAPLSNSETREFFQKLTKGRNEDVRRINQVKSLPSQYETMIEFTDVAAGVPTTKDILQTHKIPKNTNEDDRPTIRIENLEEISEQEIKSLMETFDLMQNPTPRRIKIVYYRYLLAKNILIAKYPATNDNSFWLRPANQNILMKLLILLSDKESKDIASLRQTAMVETEEKLKLQMLDDEVVSRQEFIQLIDVLETVIAY